MSVALAVSARLFVAALGNPNETVKVFDAVQGSRIDPLRQRLRLRAFTEV